MEIFSSSSSRAPGGTALAPEQNQQLLFVDVSINLFIGEAERHHGDDIWLQVETGETCRDPA